MSSFFTLTPGLTLFQVGQLIIIKNTSRPSFDSYVLEIDGNDPRDFPPESELEYSYTTEGIKIVTLTGIRYFDDGTFYYLQKSITFDVGFAPNFILSYNKREDQSKDYEENYVISGSTFSFSILEGNVASSPKDYVWNYGEAITFSSATASTQIIRYDSPGQKELKLGISNRFGTDISDIIFLPINVPSIQVIANPTFGTIEQNTSTDLRATVVSGNGHRSEDVEFTWTISGEVFEGNRISYSFGSTGIVGVTLFYQSKIISGLSGYTYNQYLVTREIQEIPLYYDPTVILGFAMDPGFADLINHSSEISYYKNLLKQYGTEYRYINNSIGITPGTTWSSQTVPGQIARYLHYKNNLGWTGPVMVNVEYPWLVMLQAKQIDQKWLTSPQVIQEAARQGVDLSTLTVSGFRELAVNCWRDLNKELEANDCPYWIHYASTGVAFHSFHGIPFGMIKLGPIEGLTTRHFYYQGNTGANPWSPTLRRTFNDRILNNSYATGTNAFNDVMRAQSNGPVHGPAAYSFVPNSLAGFCGATYWRNDSVTTQPTTLRLIGFSGGVTFVNGGTFNPIDYTEEALREAVKVTSAEMWLEYYRACILTIENGLVERRHLPSRYAAIVSNTVAPIFRIQYPGGLWMSKNKWYGSLKKDPERTAEDEIEAIYKTNPRVKYSDYPEIKKPDEIWIWNATNYYHLVLPRVSVPPVVSWDYSKTDDINAYCEILMIRNAQEIEFFGRPELSPGHTLWFSGSTTDNITYYSTNSLPETYWRDTTNRIWWGFSGGTYTSFLPSPCNFNRNSPLAPWLNFDQEIRTNNVILAIKHKLSQDAVDYLMYSRQKLNALDI